MNASLVRQLKRIVGAEHVYAGRCDAEVYSYDASLAVAAPEAVVLPADTQQTAAVVRAAAAAGVPYVPRGFGTNLSGGSIAPRGGVVIGLSRLDRILDLRPEGRYAVVQAGVTNLDLQNALAPLGFYYAPDPASQKVSTLGGNVGENSGGPHCLKYGVTTNHVLGMTAVLPGGDVLRVAGPALDPPGYDLRGVLVGSEGTLAIITELVVRILPLPETVLTLLAVYDDVADAAQSVSDIISAGIVPATLEMMDATVIRAVEDSKPCGYPRDAAAVLIAEVDGPAAGLAEQARRIGELCTNNRCREVRRARDAAQRDLLWSGRRGAFGAIARAAPSFLVADCTVPRTRLPEALARVAAIAAEHGLAHGNVFHAGDGNLHPLLLFDSRDPDQVRRVHEAGSRIMAACVALGGTITGEHGVGVEKSAAMRLVFSEDDLEYQRRLRAAFDPRDLLNPGKVLPAAAILTRSASEGQPRSASEGQPRSASEGQPRSASEGQPPSDPAILTRSASEGQPRSASEGQPRSASEGQPRSASEGQPRSASEGQPRSASEGEPLAPRQPVGSASPEWVPADAAEACELVRRAHQERLALVPRGNGTEADFGNCMARDAVPLRSARLSVVSECDPANQVIAAGAGMTLGSLQDVLAENGQWLPLRPPRATSRTLGGIAALGACGPERLRYGAPRDLLLGLKFVSGEGRLISAGGRVVKNVAGYDVTRLLAGSAGTLGFITEVTLRVLSLPESCAAVAASGPLAACGAAAAGLLRSKIEPAFVVAVPDDPAIQARAGGAWRFVAGFEGFGETVDFQAESCRELAEKAGLSAPVRRQYGPREGACREFFQAIWDAPFRLRFDLPLDRVAAFLGQGCDLPRNGAVLADFGCGRLTVAAPELTDALWPQCCRAAEQHGGHVILEKAPESFRRRYDVFGPPRADWPLVSRLKAALDPHDVFSPGRMAGLDRR